MAPKTYIYSLRYHINNHTMHLPHPLHLHMVFLVYLHVLCDDEDRAVLAAHAVQLY